MKNFAVLTSGGDAPAMNACIRAVVRTFLKQKETRDDLGNIYGIKHGYNGLIQKNLHELNSRSVSNIIGLGGTILKSARSEDFRSLEGRAIAATTLKEHEIDHLIVIGGDGSFTGANLLFQEHQVSVVGIPGTIDNDIYGTDFTVGYDTAINTAIEAVDRIRDTANSHERVFFVEVMGRDSGYIAIPTAIGGGAEVVIIPEEKPSVNEVVTKIEKAWKRHKTSCIIITAEGSQAASAKEAIKEINNRFSESDIRMTVLGHIQRGGRPTAMDRMLASQLGIAAVEALLDGKSDIMVGAINQKIVHTKLAETYTKHKPISHDLTRMTDILS